MFISYYAEMKIVIDCVKLKERKKERKKDLRKK